MARTTAHLPDALPSAVPLPAGSSGPGAHALALAPLPAALRIPLGVLWLLLLTAGTAARAQSPSPNQPLAIDRQGLDPAPCPLIVPAKDAVLQPLRIRPSQVAAKNALGCLSPADASRYGPDGCPLKLCREAQSTMPLPNL